MGGPVKAVKKIVSPPKPPAPPPPPKEPEVPTVDEAISAEEERKKELEKQQKTYRDKVARGIVGTRSLFARAGGRGFFS